MRKLYLFFLCIITLVSYAQSQNIDIDKSIKETRKRIAGEGKAIQLEALDSIINFLEQELDPKYDTIYLEAIAMSNELDSITKETEITADLIYRYNQRDAAQGQKLFEDYLKKDFSRSSYHEKARLYLNGADSYYFMGDYKKALKNYKKADSLSRKTNNLRLTGLIQLYTSELYAEKGDFITAVQEYPKAIKLLEKVKDTFNIIGSKIGLSILYSKNGFYEESAAEATEVIALARKAKIYSSLSVVLYNKAIVEKKLGHPAEQLKLVKGAYEANKKSEYRSQMEPSFLSGLIKVLAQQGKLKQAKDYLDTIQNKPAYYREGVNEMGYKAALMEISLAGKNYKNALKLGEGYREKTNQSEQIDNRIEAENFLYRAYKSAGKTPEALRHYERSINMRDSLSGILKAKLIAYYKTIYETEKQKHTIENQKKDIALLDSLSKNRRNWILFGGLGLVFAFVLIMMSRSRNAVRKRNELQEQFAQELIQAQENERSRLAMELHDSVGQKIMLLSRKTKSKNDPDMESLAGKTLEELRSISRGLHPPTLNDFGITQTIINLINEIDEHSSIFFTNEIENIDDVLSKETSLHLYRIFQEILNNMVKHSAAREASVTIKKDARMIRATIIDNGIGFAVDENINNTTTLGMKTLMERMKIIKSRVEINSNKNGTKFHIYIPFA
tara:strand:- start:14680 stop:16698 length:2019 start_codon:yes stop_codon:yes gene_type:complete